jgi:uncharacterized membrane protein YbhN (UPF0104 family)
MKRIRWWLQALKIILSAVILFLLVQKVDYRAIREAFSAPERPVFIVWGAILLIPNMLIQWYRWHVLLRLVQPDLGGLESLGSWLGGMVTAFITPGRIGEMGRSLFLSKVDRLSSLGLLVIDKLYTSLTIVWGGLWAVTIFIGRVFAFDTFLFWPLAVVVAAIQILTFMLALHPEWVRNALYHLTVLFPSKDKMRNIIAGMDRFQKAEAVPFLALSGVLYVVYILQFCLFAMAFMPVKLGTALIATASTIFAKMLLPISFADLGIREGAAVFFFTRLGVDKVAAFNGSILIFAFNVLLPTLIGVAFLPRMSWKRPSGSKSV